MDKLTQAGGRADAFNARARRAIGITAGITPGIPPGITASMATRLGAGLITGCIALGAATPALAADTGNAPDAAAASNYPNNSIRLVVGYTAGGASDIVTRTVAKALAEQLHGSVVVENRPGAASNIGAQYVAQAKPDGYTLMLGTIAFSVNPTLYKKLPFDPLKDFAPISEVASTPFILAATEASGIKSVPDLIKAARAANPPLTYASAGIGSGANLFMEYFKSQAKIPLTHIPYAGTTPALTDMFGGRVPLTFDNIMTTLPPVKQGKFVGLAVSTAQPSSMDPSIPPLAKYIPGFDTAAWFGLFAPAKTPPAIIQKLHDATVRAMQQPDVIQVLHNLGSDPVTSPTPADFGKFYRGEIAKWGKVVRDSHMELQ